MIFNNLRILPAALCALLALVCAGCFDDDNSIASQYGDWKAKNDEYVASAENRVENGDLYYTRLAPDWAPDAFTLVHWHNDPAKSPSQLTPMDNSTVKITYELFNIDGVKISDSFASSDSLYICKPSQNIVGVWYALTKMHVGDSISMVIPAQAGYGSVTYGNIPPFSTLIYNIKLKEISAYDVE